MNQSPSPVEPAPTLDELVQLASSFLRTVLTSPDFTTQEKFQAVPEIYRFHNIHHRPRPGSRRSFAHPPHKPIRLPIMPNLPAWASPPASPNPPQAPPSAGVTTTQPTTPEPPSFQGRHLSANTPQANPNPQAPIHPSQPPTPQNTTSAIHSPPSSQISPDPPPTPQPPEPTPPSPWATDTLFSPPLYEDNRVSRQFFPDVFDLRIPPILQDPTWWSSA